MIDTLEFKHEHRQILMAIKTKPFVMLAGLSGVGKSRMARTLAYKTCFHPSLKKTSSPENFLLIQVKPNWNDSSDLLGYESVIQNRYKITPFVKFLVKACHFTKIPFFVCLDEMNLAPVELYFAEYLSAIESRKKIGNRVISDPLISKDIFNKFKSDEDFWLDLGAENNLKSALIDEGLRIPGNLVVIGTVNMDETTHSFSRKVLDRAMTIEMNEIRLDKLKVASSDWEFPDEFYSSNLVFGSYLAASDIEKRFPSFDKVLRLLDDMNSTALFNSPFMIGYRAAQEILLYSYYCSEQKDGQDHYTDILDEIIFMKVLPRIEGNEEICEYPLKELEKIALREQLKKSKDKIVEMQQRLNKTGNTSFFHGSY